MKFPTLRQTAFAAVASVGLYAAGAANEAYAQTLPDGSGGGPTISLTYPPQNGKGMVVREVDCATLVALPAPKPAKPDNVALWGTCEFYGQVDIVGNDKMDGTGGRYCTKTDNFSSMSPAKQNQALREAFVDTLSHFAIVHFDCEDLYERSGGKLGREVKNHGSCKLIEAANMCRNVLGLN